MAKSISDKIAELKEGVDWFYSDDFKLEDASKRYRALTTLVKEIEQDLDNLKNDEPTEAEIYNIIEASNLIDRAIELLYAVYKGKS